MLSGLTRLYKETLTYKPKKKTEASLLQSGVLKLWSRSLTMQYALCEVQASVSGVRWGKVGVCPFWLQAEN